MDLKQIPRPIGDDSPTVVTEEAATLVLWQRLLSIHKHLLGFKSYYPSEETNDAFTDLVNFVVQSKISHSGVAKMMQLPEMETICIDTRRVCGEAETLLELYWADCLITGQSELGSFPYHDNYTHLVRMEYHLLCGQAARPRNVMFIGSGPLPLSSLILAKEHMFPSWSDNEWSILNVDICPRSNQKGSALAKKLFPEVEEHVSFLTCDGVDIDAKLIQQCDVICLAALVGHDTSTKDNIVRHLILHMKPGSRILLRSATGLRCLMYPEVDEMALLEAAKGLLELEVVCHPHNFVINSVVIARRI